MIDWAMPSSSTGSRAAARAAVRRTRIVLGDPKRRPNILAKILSRPYRTVLSRSASARIDRMASLAEAPSRS